MNYLIPPRSGHYPVPYVTPKPVLAHVVRAMDAASAITSKQPKK